MKIAITWTSQKLSDLLTDAQIKTMIKTKNNVPRIDVIVQNDADISSVNVYVSFGRPAVAWESLKMIPDAILSFDDVTLEDTNIIATAPTNIIIELN